MYLEFRVLRPLAGCLLIASLAACGDRDQTAGADAPPAGEVAATAPAPAPAPERPADALSPEDLITELAMVEAPAYVAETDTLRFRVRVTNYGSAVLTGEGEHPVALGVVHVDAADETVFQPIAVASRDTLPVIGEGESGEVRVEVPAESILGKSLRLDLFQQNVAWFGKNYGLPVLLAGPFSRCDGAEGTLCNSDGTALSN